MDGYLSIRELATLALPTGSEDGLFLMAAVITLRQRPFFSLKGFFDDSGTHDDSDVVVIGGLIGTVGQWEQFEMGWAAKLAAPLPGKPPLRMFHLSHCAAADGEFKGYSEPERDAVTHDFRKIIIDAKLMSVASAIDRKAWDELVTGPYRQVLGEAVDICAENCVTETIRIADSHPDGDKVALVFDRGIWTQRLKEITDEYTLPLGRPRIVSVNFLAVADALGLQGADIVATESYWHALRVLRDGFGAPPRAHLRHYVENMLCEGLILDREAIVSEIARRGPDGMVRG
jgi:hypothetical protein